MVNYPFFFKWFKQPFIIEVPQNMTWSSYSKLQIEIMNLAKQSSYYTLYPDNLSCCEIC